MVKRILQWSIGKGPIFLTLFDLVPMNEMLFKNFDFSVLDSADFKEDAVREEIIAPMLKKLGYLSSGSTRVQRSKTLVHPYVMIGSKKHKINIVPDYTLYADDIPLAIIEAKGPQEVIYKSAHVEQAYSYAIHPEIRVSYYGLCNGRELVFYSISQWEPVLRVPVQEIDSHWKAVEQVLLPRYLLDPSLRGFMPDYGMTMLKMGLSGEADQIFVSHQLQSLMRAEDDLYVLNTATGLGDTEYMVTLDMTKKMYDHLLSFLPSDVSGGILNAMKRAPFQANLAGKVVASIGGIFGEITHGQFEDFVPIKVTKIIDAHYNPDLELHPYCPS